MRRIAILLTALLFCITLQAQGFGGSWGAESLTRKNNVYSWTLSLSLWNQKGKYVGGYVYIYEFGDRIEIGKVEILSQKKDTVRIKIIDTGNFHPKATKCILKFLSKDSIKFVYPKNINCSLPNNIVLKKEKSEKDIDKKFFEEYAF